MLLEGKVVLVTGGGRGIGAGICRVLAQEGAAVAINYSRSEDKARALKQEIEQNSGRAEVFSCDVRDTEAVDAMMNDIHRTFGRIDAVINNAIDGRQAGSIDEATWEDYQTAFDFGAKAVINTVKAARPYMKKQGGGRIVNIVTEVWDFAPGQWSVYMSGKGAMVGISRSLAEELGPDNITVNMVAPGWMRTERVTKKTNTSHYVSGVPLGRQGATEEIGKVCAFLISELGDFVSGAYIPVTGGRVRKA